MSARAQALGAANDLRCPVTGDARAVVRCALPPGRWQVTLYYSPTAAGTYLSVGALPITVEQH